MSGSSSSISADKMNKDVVFLIAAIHAFLVSVPSLIFSLTQASPLWAHTLMSLRVLAPRDGWLARLALNCNDFAESNIFEDGCIVRHLGAER